ncbi:MAG: hypothetical protein Kow00121_12160 [Elainellaceae cyanobacterium]
MAQINGTIFNDNDTVDSNGILRPALVGDLQGVPEADSIKGDRGNDILRGLGGNDVLNGGDGNDLLEGGDGNDRLAGDKGNDTMDGGAGDDLLFWIDGDGSDVMLGGTGTNDTVQFVGASTVTRPNGSKVPADDILTLGLDFSSGKVLLKRTSPGPITLTIDDVEAITVAGVEGNDQLTVGELAGSDVRLIQFDGFVGNDILDGRTSTATIDAKGGSGNDILMGGNRDDLLKGESGNDALFGGIGSDTLTGADTSLAILGRGEQDVLVGGAGPDRFILGDRGGVNNGRRIFYDDGDNIFDGNNNIFTGMDGVSDFAHIVDFSRSQGDTIQLAGSASDYVIRDLDPRGPLSRGSVAQVDVGIFKVRPAPLAPDELIAIVQDVGSGTLNLNNRSQFVFV